MYIKTFVLGAVLLSAGCANNPGLTTASVMPPTQTADKADPACKTLLSQIQALRGEGTIGRVEKAADGETRVVGIKRAALGKVAELNALNAKFQTRCADPTLTTAATGTKQGGSAGDTVAKAKAAAKTAETAKTQAEAVKAKAKAAQKVANAD